MRCPKCDGQDSFLVASGRDYLHHLSGITHVTECRKCGFWFQNPAPPTDRLEQLYPAEYRPHRRLHDSNEKLPSISPNKARYFINRMGYPSGLFPLCPPIHWRSRISDRFFSHWNIGVEMVPRYIPEGRLLEIGCGNGERLLKLRSLGWHHLYGIELVPAAAAQARAEGLNVEAGRIEEVLENYPPGHFDVVIASMVLEHLLNPFQVVRQVAEKLTPGGQFLFSTILRDCWEAKWYGEYWAGFDFPRHLVYFRRIDILDMVGPYFERVEFFHQAAPIDFIRSSTWRSEDGKGRAWDRLVLALGESRPVFNLHIALAWAKKTCRVSYRCLKKDAGNVT
jgi:2-polyprenyl-3-methyl-5-hydroxy-6-metoxy-1,4-benzoquinol methylase